MLIVILNFEFQVWLGGAKRYYKAFNIRLYWWQEDHWRYNHCRENILQEPRVNGRQALVWRFREGIQGWCQLNEIICRYQHSVAQGLQQGTRIASSRPEPLLGQSRLCHLRRGHRPCEIRRNASKFRKEVESTLKRHHSWYLVHWTVHCCWQ